MSLFRALKAKLFNSRENHHEPKNIQIQTESQALSQTQTLMQEPPIAALQFQRHFSLKIHATEADATSREEDATHGIMLYHYDTPQAIELLGWENAHECCDFHHTEFDRLEIDNSSPFPEQHFWLGKEKVCSIIPKQNGQTKELRQVELNNLEALLRSHFTLDADNIVQGDIQDYASLTGKLHRTFHQIDTEQGLRILRIVTQAPDLTQAVDSNYFGEREGVTRQFDALGTLLFEGHFVNDQQLGVQTWYDHDGRINQREDRHPNGMYISHYYEDGQLKETAELDSDGRYINTLTRYYPSGQVQLIRPLLTDTLHGIEKQYYQDGSLEAERHYDQGREYRATWYHANGVIKQKMSTDHSGKVIEEFYDTGKPAWRESFNANGKLQGESLKWHPNGQLEEQNYFENGKEQGTALWYHENGQLALEIDLENGLREGQFRSYFPSGVLSAEGQYKDNLSIAPFIEYYENQQIQMYLPHTAGNRDGTARWFYEDGTIRSISVYEVREGQGYLKESSFYNEQGVLTSYQHHSNTRCGYILENNQREYYQEGIADTRIEYYENGAIRWLLTRTLGDIFSAKTLSPEGVILETGTLKILDDNYTDIGHWQRFNAQGQVNREVWLDDQGVLIESRHYFDANEDGSDQAEAAILSYQLKYDPASKLYGMKRYHPNGRLAEEGNLNIQGQEKFWVGIHNQYDEQGKLKLSETYTMAGEPIEHTTNSSSIMFN
ncbi:toxin-antitoxin system YwqK family antitoxin [Shewanella sp. CG12_big_fil_rev_8_21_14_0_65_47_15]|uniref:toxin-antitoxin system YwqK family antitoxin n=1 Tax=Shewanella sp. CG12_big_fil_rev_8_21_14_0_65_47_15 TaxID=1975537 RepID=UPI000CC8171F|nr:toxin-antitoxin system YwqK family antitoxin [Shewanella sp. CG12_big_fil_rev_8_21_14_0_65_47_15]PIW62015.1 MAG: hypothetical protein COW15_05400 [Shewanella sp. CG12_big_fil_rev_8_21_14_0_65_47_15]